MITVWHYPIAKDREIYSIAVPWDARFLGIHENGERNKSLYYEVNTESQVEKINFQNVMTGQPVPKGGIYMGTYQWLDLVFHLYRV